MPSRSLFLVNPRARQGGNGADRLAARLDGLGLDPVVEPIDDPARLPDLIRRHAGRIDRVIVGGGDGTLGAAVPGLVERDLPLGVIPLGTANNLARTLGIPSDPEAACALIAAGYHRRIDLGLVNDRYFFTTASLGLSVRITEELSPGMKRRWGAVAYALAALKAMRRSRPFRAEITWDGGTRKTRTVQIVVGNGRYYGAALAVARDAAIDDARLDLYSLEVNHWWELARLAPSLKRGTHVGRGEVGALRAEAFEVRTRRPMAINLDGELGAETPASFRVVPRALEVYVPAPEMA
jgi:YegS/Rv2252/BmrU family lipid kinase